MIYVPLLYLISGIIGIEFYTFLWYYISVEILSVWVGTYRQSGRIFLGGTEMFEYVWPIVLVVVSNVVYQLCTKSVPSNVDPFASLTVTYVVGAVLSAVMYYVLGNNTGIIGEVSKMNWSSYALGISVVGLEVGFIYAYKAGWQISTTSIVQSAVLTVILIFIGVLFYKESLSWNKIVGIVICIIGLVFINIK